MNSKFLDKLFPFFNSSNEDPITQGFILFLLIFFVLSWGYLFYKSYVIRKELKIDRLPESSTFASNWAAYKASFNNYNSLEKTTAFSEIYFNEYNVLFAGMNFRFVNNIPSLLIGIGILGTFVGLTYGISDSNFETTEAIKLSITKLLSGMGTAFVTSIWGMGLSLFFTIILKFSYPKTSNKIQQLCFSLDETYKISEQDLEKVEQEKQRSIINELFNEYLVAETDTGKQLPKNVFRQLLEENQKQTTSLQSFADDLADSIEKAMDQLVESNTEQLIQIIEEKLVPVLNDLKAIKQESGKQVIDDAVKLLTDSMKSMMEEFKTLIAGDTKEEMEALTKRLMAVADSLNSVPKYMENITDKVGKIIFDLQTSVTDNINTSNEESAQHNRAARELFASTSAEYQLIVKNIQEEMSKLVSTQKENIDQVSTITDKINTTLQENSAVNQQFTTLIEKYKTVTQLINDISDKFGQNSTTLDNTSTVLKSTIDSFENSINDYVNRNNGLLDKQKETQEKTKEVLDISVNRFALIESGLTGIFSQLQQGLKEYETTTASNLNTYLREFTTTLTNAQEGLASNVGGLSDIADELSEQIEKMRTYS